MTNNQEKQQNSQMSSGLRKIVYFIGAMVILLGFLAYLNSQTNFLDSLGTKLMKMLIG